ARAHQAHAVVGERAKAARPRRGQDLARRRPARHQLVDRSVDIEELEERLAAAVALVLALLAADGARDRRRHGGRDTEEPPLAPIGIVRLTAGAAELAYQPVAEDGSEVYGTAVGQGDCVDIDETGDTR